MTTNQLSATTGYFSGKVGIGTASPQRPIHAVGTDGAVASFPTLGAKDFAIVENNGNAGIGVVTAATGVGALKFYKSGGGSYQGLILYDMNSDYMAFSTAGAAERMRITRSVRLPFEPKDGDVSATFKDGVLTIQVPKPAELQKPIRRIEVKSV